MPEALCSGKHSARAAVMPSLCASSHFPQSGMAVSGTRICYNIAMAKQSKSDEKVAKAGGLVIGRARFAKISAAEGSHLTQAMEKRAIEAHRRGLTAEEYRQIIVCSYRKA